MRLPEQHLEEVGNHPEVLKVRRALRRLKRIWPHSQGVWLASMSGRLHLMAAHEDGTRTNKNPDFDKEGMDSELVIESFDIPNDGGDW